MVEIVAAFDGAVQTVRWLRGGAREFTLGADERAGFVVPDDWRPAPLVRLAESGDYEVVFDAAMSGARLSRDRQRATLDELIARGEARRDGERWTCVIGAGERFELSRGALAFTVTQALAPEPHALAPRYDWIQLLLSGVTAAAFSLCLLVYLVTPHRPKYLRVSVAAIDPRWDPHLLFAPVFDGDQIYGRLPIWLSDHADGRARERADVVRAPTAGERESLGRGNRYGLRGPVDNPDPFLARSLAEAEARRAGVLGILTPDNGGSGPGSIFGSGSAIGNDAGNALAGLVDAYIQPYSGGGLGLVGSGMGGGGTGEGTIGLGNLGTIGRGEGTGYGSGYAHGAGGLGGRRAHAPDVIPGTAHVVGGLDPEIARRIVRRHMNEVRFCYERELARAPALHGRVTIQFTIDARGQVPASAVQQSTINNPAVEQCVAAAFRRFEFPKPQGGGLVMVTYPIVFMPSGD
ncbi:MAG TPA: TonB family protein [Polyangia bacterium]|nr:TonB family protein [Polyangia bacterium]